jgi:hypothetical protein
MISINLERDKMGKNSKIPHCENISKVQQKNCRNKMENKYYPIIVTVPKSNKKKHRKNQNRYLLSYVSVLENTMWYDRSLGQRVDVGILAVVTVKSAVDCE